MIDDTLAWPILVNLAAAMTVEAKDSGLQPFCFEGIMPGGAIALDYCTECGKSCGMAWVRLASIREEPSEIDGGFSTCFSQFTVNIEMGMIRCHQTVTESGEPMPLEYQFAAAQRQMAEMAAMKRVLLCSDAARQHDKLLGQYLPIGPEGGCVGGAWTAQFEVV